MDSNCYIYDVDPYAGHYSLIQYSTMCPSRCNSRNDVSSVSKVNIQSDVLVRTSILKSTYERICKSFMHSPMTQSYGRPPPWPSKTCVQSVEIYIRTFMILVFIQMSFLFHSIYCSYKKKKIALTFFERSQVQFDTSKELKTTSNTKESFKSTVIKHSSKKQNNFRSSSTFLYPGLFKNIKSSLVLLFIVIHCLSNSHLIDHSSSNGSKRHIVASAISNSNGVKKNGVSALRCYVCGGNTGLPCEDIRSAGRRSPYVRPKPQTTLDGRKMFENCTDLINNKGCIKQVINGEVLLRGCWMQAVEACMDDGHATVCTCKTDLCNSSSLLNYNPLTYCFSVLLCLLTSVLYLKIAHSSCIT